MHRCVEDQTLKEGIFLVFDLIFLVFDLSNHSPALVLSSADLRVCKVILGLIFAKFHFLRVSDFAEKRHLLRSYELKRVQSY